MAYGFTQSKSVKDATSGTTTNLAYTSNNVVGGLLVAICYWHSGTATCSFSDSQGNTWQAIGSPQVGTGALAGWSVQMFCAPNCKAGANTVTATTSVSVSERGFAIAEYSGCNQTSSPVDAQNAGNFSGSASVVTPSVTTTGGDELLVAGGMVGTGAPQTAGSGWTLRESTNWGNNVFEDKATGAAGSYTGAWTDNLSTDNATAVAAFKIAVASGGLVVVSQAVNRAATY